MKSLSICFCSMDGVALLHVNILLHCPWQLDNSDYYQCCFNSLFIIFSS